MAIDTSPGATSYLPVLIKVLQVSDGPVLSLGAGPVGLSVMHWLCLEDKRHLVSYEVDPAMHEINHVFNDSVHTARSINDWNEAQSEMERWHWGVAFMDHLPAEQRREDVIRLAKTVDYIIVHDSEGQREAEFGFEQYVFPLFRYVYHYRRKKPYTAVLSNFTDFVL